LVATARTRRSRAVHCRDFKSFSMQGPLRRVVARVEGHGFFPQRVLMRQPGRAVPDLNVREARLVQPGD